MCHRCSGVSPRNVAVALACIKVVRHRRLGPGYACRHPSAGLLRRIVVADGRGMRALSDGVRTCRRTLESNQSLGARSAWPGPSGSHGSSGWTTLPVGGDWLCRYGVPGTWMSPVDTASQNPRTVPSGCMRFHVQYSCPTTSPLSAKSGRVCAQGRRSNIVFPHGCDNLRGGQNCSGRTGPSDIGPERSSARAGAPRRSPRPATHHRSDLLDRQ
jgi:hypothetical protein